MSNFDNNSFSSPVKKKSKPTFSTSFNLTEEAIEILNKKLSISFLSKKELSSFFFDKVVMDYIDKYMNNPKNIIKYKDNKKKKKSINISYEFHKKLKLVSTKLKISQSELVNNALYEINLKYKHSIKENVKKLKEEISKLEELKEVNSKININLLEEYDLDYVGALAENKWIEELLINEIQKIIKELEDEFN